MPESYEHLQGSEMDVDSHPSDNIQHPAPGPKGTEVAKNAARIAAFVSQGSPALYATAAMTGVGMAAVGAYDAYKRQK